MLHPLSHRALLPTVALGAVLALSACGESPGDNAPPPTQTLPTPVQSLVVGTDVGQFFVTPEGKSQTEIDETVAKLKSMGGVQSSEFKDGMVDVVFRPNVTKEQREEAVRQLGALGEVQEGI